VLAQVAERRVALLLEQQADARAVLVFRSHLVETVLVQPVRYEICHLNVVEVGEGEMRVSDDSLTWQVQKRDIAAQRIHGIHELQVYRVHPVPEVQPEIGAGSRGDVVPELHQNRNLS
jgi:hypothetical protein